MLEHPSLLYNGTIHIRCISLQVVVDPSVLEVKAHCNKTWLPELRKESHNHDVHRHKDKKKVIITATMMTSTTEEEGDKAQEKSRRRILSLPLSHQRSIEIYASSLIATFFTSSMPANLSCRVRILLSFATRIISPLPPLFPYFRLRMNERLPFVFS